MLVDTIRLPASYVKRNSWIKDIHFSTALHMKCIMLGNCGRNKSKIWLQTRICGYGHRWRTLLDVSTPSEMELAAVGTYTPRWVEKLDKKEEFSAPQMKKMKRLMGLICRGARVVMRAYTRTCCDKGRDKEDKRKRGIERSQELRQLRISDLTKMGASDAPPGKRKKKAKEVLPLGECEPPQGFLEEIHNDTISIGIWKK